MIVQHPHVVLPSLTCGTLAAWIFSSCKDGKSLAMISSTTMG